MHITYIIYCVKRKKVRALALLFSHLKDTTGTRTLEATLTL